MFIHRTSLLVKMDGKALARFLVRLRFNYPHIN